LADPSKLKPLDEYDARKLKGEAPKGSRKKFAFEQAEPIFELKKVLPAVMAFPCDFGFVPSTKADDGDPVDVLVLLMDEPASPACVVHGVIEAEQGDGDKTERNDRVIALEIANHQWATINIDGLGEEFLEKLEEFFVNYHNLSGKEYRLLNVHGPNRALKLVLQKKEK
jgi:inorganic pyrophosphatase